MNKPLIGAPTPSGWHYFSLARALAVYLLTEGLEGRAVSVSRWAIGVFAVFFSAYDGAVGIGTGYALRNAQELSAGATGILANLFLIAFYALQASHPEDGASLGSANDLVGSLASAFMIPAVLALNAWLPDRRLMWITLLVGLPALAVLTVGGPLLVFGVIAFSVQAPIMVAAWMVLCLWLFLINRWLRLSAALRPRLARLGEFLGAGTLAGGTVVGLGFLLPWMSWPQLVAFGAGGLLGVIGMLGIPVWFLFLGRHFAAS